VLVLTTFELDEYVFGALRAGASGFLLKGGEPSELLSAIHLVAAGESLLARALPNASSRRTSRNPNKRRQLRRRDLTSSARASSKYSTSSPEEAPTAKSQKPST